MYMSTWKKYLPVIRILLKKSATAEQVLPVDRLDFEKVNKLRKPVCSFSMEMINGKLSPFSPAVSGKELADVLREDDITRVLIRNNHYHISMNSKFELRIRNANPAEETSAVTEPSIENAEAGKD